MPSLEPYVNDVRQNGTPGFPKVNNWEELKAVFKCDVDRSLGWDITPVGQACWFLDGFLVRDGVAAYITKVQKNDGSPYPDILVFRHWPGVDTPPFQPHPPYFPNATGGFTNGVGDWGSPYSGGSAIGNDGGPDYIWVSSSPPPAQPQYSDMATKLGWGGDTDHAAPHPIFRYVVKQDDGTTPPTPGDNHIIVRLKGEVGYIAIQTTPPPAGSDYQEIRLEGKTGYVPIGDNAPASSLLKRILGRK